MITILYLNEHFAINLGFAFANSIINTAINTTIVEYNNIVRFNRHN